jgi:hypothetical protein
MVAKGFLAAAAIIICCSTTLQGNDQKTDCTDGKCPLACSKEKCSTEKCSTEKCSTETTACADGQCDDGKCCEKEKVALEKCATEKCVGSKCAKGEYNSSQVAKVAKLKCVAEAAAGDENCCEKKKCSAVAAAAGCPSSKCALQTAVANQRNGGQCPVAACAGQVASALQCAIDACTPGGAVESCSIDAVCATGACGTSRCATQQAARQDCPAGECGANTVSIEVCNGLKCAVQASITANGGELTFSAARCFPGTPVVEPCSTEADCPKSACSKAACTASTCSTSACNASKCSTESVATSKCAGGQCAKAAGNVAQQAVRIVNEDRAIQQEMLAAKLAEQQRLQREIDMLRRLVDATELEARLDEGQSAYETALLVAAAIEPDYKTVVYPVPDLQVWKVRPDGVEFDADLLVDYIVTTVDPLSWRGRVYPDPTIGERANGEIQPFERNGSLVICQTEANHAKIAELFQMMRVAGEGKQARRELEERREKGEVQVKIEHGDDGVVRATCKKGQCGKGQCSQAKCSEGECDKSAVSVETECSGQCPGECADECHGVCTEQTAERPAVEETSTK